MPILQNILRIAACSLVITAGACKKEETLTKTEDNRLYHLPQGNQPYDQEIMDFYKEYNVVILYKFSALDFSYSPNGPNPPYVTATPAEPGQVKESLDFLHEQWFNLYSKSFLKQALPFKILLASDLGESYSAIYGRNCRNLLSACRERIQSCYIRARGKDQYYDCRRQRHRERRFA